ncbi:MULTISPECIES: septal ring lytic transglycosylase RlpA family protein [Methylovorus]|uniref:septal ring lytic transglycosylase RlpA family protein n=1 Tax=Methylovorus TaxID=81682 RepID=UPI0001EC4E17|nr:MULTISPECIES: septal ring lytic transglycosylase RlpA family protein [Methylovorus]ADQ85628.1 rare lipoprotein A [Methylovorus sp. MP688]KAF0842963.1 rare lipoprotein A [Methylovorus glucosotrophus]
MRLPRYLIALAIPLWLSACGGSTTVKPDNTTPGASTSGTPTTPAPKRGGYYLDDGPGDNPPADIDAIPDAVPRAEALLPRANRPYIALGVSYKPMTEYQPYKQRGIASWYGRRYHGQKTSSGEIYDMYGMTGAHTTLPLPSYVRVTNPENGRSVIVRINDRGPFHSDRLIDLSYAAAYKLRLSQKGSGLVEVEAIDTRPGAKPLPSVVTPAPATPMPPPSAPVSDTPLPQPATANALPQVDNTASIASGDYVQVGAFKLQSNADALSNRIREQGLAGNVATQSWYNNGTYRVLLGPYSSRAEADRAAANIKQTLGTTAIVIRK